MNMTRFFNKIITDEKTYALPILSFPAMQKLGVTVKEMLTSAKLQAQAMEVVAHSTNTIASVSLMDLSLEAEAFGANVVFGENEVPAITGRLVSDEEEAKSLPVPPLTAGRIPTAIEAIRLAKEKITDKPILAGILGPYSLAGRLMDVTEIMYTCYDEPDAVHEVLRKASEFLTNYTLALKEAGADGIVMAEPLAGLLSPDMAEEFSCPYVKQIIDAVQTEEFAVIYHNCGNSVPQIAHLFYPMGAAAYHYGNAIDMLEMLEAAPADAVLMGNIDPVAYFKDATPKQMEHATLDLLHKCSEYKNFILSSGCDIPHTASWDNVDAFFRALDAYNLEG